jgi:ATP-dependent exoDNAse (exonuclease V) beta subunit
LTPDASNAVIFWLQLSKIKNLACDDELMAQINTINQKDFQKNLKKHGYDIDFQSVEKMTLIDAAMAFIAALKINKKHDLHLRFFLDALIEAQSENVTTIGDFPKWWQEKGKRQFLSLSDSTDAVKVMSIHKSKGLGFPVVIYAFADKAFEKSVENIWVDLDEKTYHFPAALLPLNKDLLNTDFAERYEEEDAKNMLDLLNIFYVACTRPKNELYILSRYRTNWESEVRSIPNMLHNFLVSENLWEDEKCEYTFGIPTKMTKKAVENPVTQTDENNMPFTPWYERISIKRHAQHWTNVKTDYGILVHIRLR